MRSRHQAWEKTTPSSPIRYAQGPKNSSLPHFQDQNGGGKSPQNGFSLWTLCLRGEYFRNVQRTVGETGTSSAVLRSPRSITKGTE